MTSERIILLSLVLDVQQPDSKSDILPIDASDITAKASIDDIENAPSILPARSNELELDVDVDTLWERLSSVAEENARLQQELSDLRRGTSTIRELDGLIKPSAKNAFRYMSCYSLGSFVLLVLDGSGWGGFNLDESVLDLLVGSTAVTVLGLVGMVLTGIFVGARRALPG